MSTDVPSARLLKIGKLDVTIPVYCLLIDFVSQLADKGKFDENVSVSGHGDQGHIQWSNDAIFCSFRADDRTKPEIVISTFSDDERTVSKPSTVTEAVAILVKACNDLGL